MGFAIFTFHILTALHYNTLSYIQTTSTHCVLIEHSKLQEGGEILVFLSVEK
jgi:hypothetical protein